MLEAINVSEKEVEILIKSATLHRIRRIAYTPLSKTKQNRYIMGSTQKKSWINDNYLWMVRSPEQRAKRGIMIEQKATETCIP